jgi:hypothetical protein
MKESGAKGDVGALSGSRDLPYLSLGLEDRRYL